VSCLGRIIWQHFRSQSKGLHDTSSDGIMGLFNVTVWGSTRSVFPRQLHYNSVLKIIVTIYQGWPNCPWAYHSSLTTPSEATSCNITAGVKWTLTFLNFPKLLHIYTVYNIVSLFVWRLIGTSASKATCTCTIPGMPNENRTACRRSKRMQT
jgi:hypothetical protein